MGRKDRSGMTSSSSTRAGGGGSIKSLNGTSTEQALDNYWSTGVRNKKEIAKVLGQKGQYASEDSYAKKYADGIEKSNKQVIDKYNQDPTPYNKSSYDYVMRTQKSRSEYIQEGKENYRLTQENTLNMAAADVAKRMGYNISGSTGDFSASALNRVMGKSNADKLRRRILESARNR